MGLSPKRREIDKKRRQKWVRSKIIARRRSHPESSESDRGPQLAEKQGVLRVIGQCSSSVQNILSTYLALLSRTFTFELSPIGSPQISVEYDYVGKQSIPTTGLSPASPTALWAASRVGKGRPAGSIELRVSPSPSKIPYGGFSPVRLQMDRQWRPSTMPQGLSAVHIRPMTPSYTPPQQLLPGIRDPRRDYPFWSLSVQCGTIPSN